MKTVSLIPRLIVRLNHERENLKFIALVFHIIESLFATSEVISGVGYSK